MSAVQDGLDPQTITSDGAEIDLPTPNNDNEVVWYEFADGDSVDMELVKASGESAGVRIDAQTSPVTKGPFRLNSPEGKLFKYVRLGTGSTVRVTVLRSG